jgi:general secretion pathway protein B
VSFILDALRKSEHARQSISGASIADLPVGRRAHRQPWWIFAIAALLLTNLAVLLIVLTRNDQPAQSAPTPAMNLPQPVQTTPTLTSTQPTKPLSEEAAPPQVQYETVDRSETPLASKVPDGPALVKRLDETPTSSGVVEMTANGLPELRIDMHVYAKQRSDRFVFINMHKYSEGQTLAEGPRLDEITADGVVLYYKGQQLRLQRP